VPFEVERGLIVFIHAKNPQKARMHVLMARMTEKQTVRSRRRPTVAAVADVVQVPARARATPSAVALPHCPSYGLKHGPFTSRRDQRGTPSYSRASFRWGLSRSHSGDVILASTGPATEEVALSRPGMSPLLVEVRRRRRRASCGPMASVRRRLGHRHAFL